jgi:hypothetical protein
MRARIAVGVIERFERQLQHHLMAALPGPPNQPIEVGRVGREGEGHVGGQSRQRLEGDRLAGSETGDEDRNPRLRRNRGSRASINARRKRAVGADSGQRTEAAAFHQARIGRGREATGCSAWQGRDCGRRGIGEGWW